MHPRFRRSGSLRAFTMTELIIVIIVLAVLAVMAVTGYNTVTANARVEADKNEAQTLMSNAGALASFRTSPYASFGDVSQSNSELGAALPSGVSYGSDGESAAIAFEGRQSHRCIMAKSTATGVVDVWVKDSGPCVGAVAAASGPGGVGSGPSLPTLSPSVYAIAGNGAQGRVGDSTTNDAYVPSVVGLTYDDTSAVVVGPDHSCSTANAGNALSCWGSNSHGQLGDGTTTDRSVPTPVVGLPTLYGAIALGDGFTCMGGSGWDVYCWGSNSHGQLGNNSNVDSSSPVLVDMSSLPVGAHLDQLLAGSDHACVAWDVASVENISCWGSNNHGQLGDGTTTDRWVPTTVDSSVAQAYLDAQTGSDGSTAIGQYLTASGDNTCSTSSNSFDVFCWGNNTHGQLGDGTTTDRLVPTVMTGPTGPFDMNFPHAVIGQGSICMYWIDPLTSPHNSLACAGDNAAGQLGDGTTTERHSFVAIAAPDVGLYIDNAYMGSDHMCVVASDDTGISGTSLYCVGSNSHGQLADGTTTSRATWGDPLGQAGTWVIPSGASLHLNNVAGDNTLISVT